FDDLAIRAIESGLTGTESDAAPLLTLAELHEARGRTAEALAVLERLDAALPADSASRTDLADAYERLGKTGLALAVREGIRHTPAGSSHEARMRVARLYDVEGQPGKALEIWRSLWGEVSTP